MSYKQDELEFWLPSDVLADEDTLMDTKSRGSDSVSSPFIFPTNGSALSSPGKSVVGSTETESDEDVFLFSELTRQLSLLDGHKFAPPRPTNEKNYVHSGSPQSTLLHVESFSGLSNGSSNGSPNGPSQVSSPPTTPLASNNTSWDLIYKAAGLVEVLKSNTAGGLTSSNPPTTVFHRQGSFSTLPPPKSPPVYPNYHVPNEELLGRDGYGIRSGQVRNGPTNLNTEYKIDGLVENSGGWSPCIYSGYPNLQSGNKNHLQLGLDGRGCGFHLGGGYGVGHGYGYGLGNRVRVGNVVKSERVGTGVFLPRRYDEKNGAHSHCNAVDPRKKSGNLAAYSNKKVPIMGKNLNHKSAFTESQSQKFGCDTMTDYDALLARRISASVSMPTLQRKTTPFPEGPIPIHHEICLPQEWTY